MRREPPSPRAAAQAEAAYYDLAVGTGVVPFAGRERASPELSLVVTNPRFHPKNKQVFTPQAAILFIATGVGLYYYFQNEKEKMQEKKRPFCLFSDFY